MGVTQAEENVTTKYTHSIRVDGDNTYGYTYYCFPRRNMVGGGWTSTYVSTAGSRCVTTRLTLGYTAGSDSHTGRDWLY